MDPLENLEVLDLLRMHCFDHAEILLIRLGGKQGDHVRENPTLRSTV